MYARQVGAVLVLVLLVAAGHWLYRAGGRAAEAACAQARAAQAEAHVREVERLQREASAADARLRKALSERPAVAPRIREAVRENPSDCRVPAAVDDGLRNAIRAANEVLSR